MHNSLLLIHSLLRWVTLVLLIIATYKSLSGWLFKKPYTSGDNKISLFTMIALHLQFVIGLGLYFTSEIVKVGLSNMGVAMKDFALRFWTVEHSSLMLIAIVLITIGRITSKKAISDEAKHKKQALFFLIGLMVISIAIPWPFSKVARPWF